MLPFSVSSRHVTWAAPCSAPEGLSVVVTSASNQIESASEVPASYQRPAAPALFRCALSHSRTYFVANAAISSQYLTIVRIPVS